MTRAVLCDMCDAAFDDGHPMLEVAIPGAETIVDICSPECLMGLGKDLRNNLRKIEKVEVQDQEALPLEDDEEEGDEELSLEAVQALTGDKNWNPPSGKSLGVTKR